MEAREVHSFGEWASFWPCLRRLEVYSAVEGRYRTVMDVTGG